MNGRAVVEKNNEKTMNFVEFHNLSPLLTMMTFQFYSIDFNGVKIILGTYCRHQSLMWRSYKFLQKYQ